MQCLSIFIQFIQNFILLKAYSYYEPSRNGLDQSVHPHSFFVSTSKVKENGYNFFLIAKSYQKKSNEVNQISIVRDEKAQSKPSIKNIHWINPSLWLHAEWKCLVINIMPKRPKKGYSIVVVKCLKMHLLEKIHLAFYE